MKISVMLESYCADIEHLVREGTLRPAVQLSAALPDICAALEDSQMQSSRERYVGWCAAWLACQARSLPGERLYHLYTGRARMRDLPGPSDDLTAGVLRRLRMLRGARRQRTLARVRVWEPATRLEAFQVTLIDALVDGCRHWYRDRGASSPVVQRNLGLLLDSR